MDDKPLVAYGLTSLQKKRYRASLTIIKSILVSFLLMLIVPMVNGSFLYYFDTGSYLASGEAVGKRILPDSSSVLPSSSTVQRRVESQHAPLSPDSKIIRSERSFYYGIPLNIVNRLGGIRLVILLQITIVAIILSMFVRSLGSAELGQQNLTSALTIAITPVAVFSIVAIPDLFAGTGLAACAVLLTFNGRLGRNDQAFWYLVLIVSILMHNAIALTLTALAASWPIIARATTGRWSPKAWKTFAITLASLVVLQLTPLSIRAAMHAVDTTPPFLLGRLIGDGTAEKVLKRDCGVTHWETCTVLPYLPVTENDFLWGGNVHRESLFLGYNKMPVPRQLKIKQESFEIIKRTVFRFGGEQILKSLQNGVRQFFNLSLDEFVQNNNVIEQGNKILGPQAISLQHSAVRKNPEILEWLTILYTSSFIIALIILLRYAYHMRGVVDEANPLMMIGVCLFVGVAINALVCGGAAGVFGRYEARIVWPIVAVAIYLILERGPYRRTRQ